MKLVKKIILPVLAFGFSFIFGSVAYAATLGVLSYWDSNSNYIGRWGSAPTVYN
jgi:hypothetical protein